MTPAPPPDWQMIGSFADWSTTIVALLAFIVAAIAAKATIQTNRAQQQTLELQRQQFKEQQSREQRAQAEKVVFWPDGDRDDTVCVVNASTLPIYNVEILLPIAGGRVGRDVIVPTGESPINLDFPPPPNLYEALQTQFPRGIDMYFFDAAGNAWKRTSTGV